MADPVGDTTTAPWKFVGQVYVTTLQLQSQMPPGFGKPGFGSGVLLGKQYILTAGHNLGPNSVLNPLYPTFYFFMPGYYVQPDGTPVFPFGVDQIDPSQNFTGLSVNYVVMPT